MLLNDTEKNTREIKLTLAGNSVKIKMKINFWQITKNKRLLKAFNYIFNRCQANLFFVIAHNPRAYTFRTSEEFLKDGR